MHITKNRGRAPAWLLASACLLFSAGAAAVDEEVVVVGATPAPGAGLPAGKIPYNVQSATAEDIERAQSLDLSDFLRHNLGGVTHNDAQNNPLQADIQYRGYTVSPLLGLAQGMAVYQNGVRINEPLGDTVNWDLLPESAIHSINLISGANPLFGLNALGGALAVEMKDGFNSVGHNLEAYGGSFGRFAGTVESGGNNGEWGYYANLHYFDESGWRDESPSKAVNAYGELSRRGAASHLDLNVQLGDSDLVGNGAVPVELLAVDRGAVFTAPDRTENNLFMISLDGSHNVSDNLGFSFTAFYRKNNTDSFNGDGSELALEEDDEDEVMEALDELAEDDDDFDKDEYCRGGFCVVEGDDDDDDNGNSMAMNGDDDDEDEELELEELYGPGTLAGVGDIVAINNTSLREQKSYGANLQMEYLGDIMNLGNQLIMGVAYHRGDSYFHSETEIAGLNKETRSTEGLGSSVFLEEALTDLDTMTETLSFYVMNTMDVTDRIAVTVSGRMNDTNVKLQDRTGEHPELNGKHDYFRFNPAAGVTFQALESVNFYGSYSESSRAPTPIELACNDSVFETAAELAAAAGEDPEDIEFECRLPNAFLADPPLDEVVTRSFEAGMRGNAAGTNYHLGFFHSTNHDDILFQTTGRATGLFANVDKTRRLGFEGQLNGAVGNLDWFLAYSYLEATFEDDFTAVFNSNHPTIADGVDDELNVESGDRIPGLPKHTLKLGADYLLWEKLILGFDLVYNSDQVLRGDEPNHLDTVDGYAVVNLRAAYRFNKHFEVFARVTNLFDKDYETFGLLGEEPDEVGVEEFADFENPRFVGPGAPRAGFAGVRVSM